MARRLAAAHGLGEGDAIVDRERLDELQGHLYCLQAALEDVDHDLEVSDDPAEVRQALAWLLQNCEPLRSFSIAARTLEE